MSVVLMNLIGWGLTFDRKATATKEREDTTQGVRAYTVYYRGQPLGVVTKEGFKRLADLNLLRKQQTVELVEHYAEKAQKQGVRVVLLQNRERTQTLLKIEEV